MPYLIVDHFDDRLVQLCTRSKVLKVERPERCGHKFGSTEPKSNVHVRGVREGGRKGHALHYLPLVLRLLSALSLISPACAIAIGLLDRNSMSLATKSRRRRSPRCNSPRSSRQTF